MSFSSRTMRPEDWAQLRHFRPTERGFRDPARMGFEFMLWLDMLRRRFGAPLSISSTWRAPAHNEAAGGASQSAHLRTPCEAVDIVGLDSAGRFRLVSLAMQMGCRRIGIYENGSVHLDLDPSLPQDVLWVKV